ncbi:MAG: hypothetical protein ACR2OB_00260 [Solirubrobacteraceae bacterium]
MTAPEHPLEHISYVEYPVLGRSPSGAGGVPAGVGGGAVIAGLVEPEPGALVDLEPVVLV